MPLDRYSPDDGNDNLLPLETGWAFLCLRHQWAEARPTRALAKLAACPLCAAEMTAIAGRDLYALFHATATTERTT